MLNLNIKLQITELWLIKPVYVLKGSSIKLSLCHISRCLTPSPNQISFSDILFTSSCYGTLFQSLMLAPYCVGVKRQGVVPRGTRFWSQLLISLGWKIQVHSKCALSAWLPSPTLHRGRSRTLPISSAGENWAVHKQGLSTFSKADCTERPMIKRVEKELKFTETA